LTPRRLSSVPQLRDTAAELPKSIELEQRIGRIELKLKELLQQLELQTKRSAALQAQVDHLAARLFHT
jgi:hypothetical protein